MTAYKCDRCGKLYDKNSPRSITVSIRWFLDNWERKDLCNDCETELLDWWNAEKIEIPETEVENDSL